MSDPTADDYARAGRIGRPVARFMQKWRGWIRQRPWLNVVYRVLITLIGVVVIVVGLILVPLPGPGWLIVAHRICECRTGLNPPASSRDLAM